MNAYTLANLRRILNDRNRADWQLESHNTTNSASVYKPDGTPICIIYDANSENPEQKANDPVWLSQAMCRLEEPPFVQSIQSQPASNPSDALNQWLDWLDKLRNDNEPEPIVMHKRMKTPVQTQPRNHEQRESNQ